MEAHAVSEIGLCFSKHELRLVRFIKLWSFLCKNIQNSLPHTKYLLATAPLTVLKIGLLILLDVDFAACIYLLRVNDLVRGHLTKMKQNLVTRLYSNVTLHICWLPIHLGQNLKSFLLTRPITIKFHHKTPYSISSNSQNAGQDQEADTLSFN